MQVFRYEYIPWLTFLSSSVESHDLPFRKKHLVSQPRVGHSTDEMSGA